MSFAVKELPAAQEGFVSNFIVAESTPESRARCLTLESCMPDNLTYILFVKNRI